MSIDAVTRPERFARALDGRSMAGQGGEWAAELLVVAALQSRRAAFAPDSRIRSRARQRLLTELTKGADAPRALVRGVA